MSGRGSRESEKRRVSFGPIELEPVSNIPTSNQITNRRRSILYLDGATLLTCSQEDSQPLGERTSRQTIFDGNPEYDHVYIHFTCRERSSRIASMYAAVIKLSNENVSRFVLGSLVENQPKEHLES